MSRAAPDAADLLARAEVRPLGGQALLSVWEKGVPLGAVERALTLLGAALPGLERAALAELTIGQRDRLLLTLRERTFGPVAPCVVSCPACAETLELSLPLRDVHVDGPAEQRGTVRVDGRTYRVRPITSLDLLACADACAEALPARLLARCAEEEGVPIGSTPSPRAVEALNAELARLDPQADIRLALSCAACGAAWSTLFDVLSYLWRELDSEARRLLDEVDLLARSYGWSEEAILSLSTARRRAYLQRLGAL